MKSSHINAVARLLHKTQGLAAPDCCGDDFALLNGSVSPPFDDQVGAIFCVGVGIGDFAQVFSDSCLEAECMSFFSICTEMFWANADNDLLASSET